jgi:hypothetical protein
MTFGRYVLTATVTVPAGTAGYPTGGPGVTTTAVTSAAPGAGTTVTTQSAGPGSVLLSWTVALQTAAAAGDASNFGLYNGAVLLATSVNTGTVASFPQAAVTTYLESAATVVTVKNIGAGTAGSVYSATLTLTPMMTGDNKGVASWTGAGSPPAWSPGGFPVTLLAKTPLYLESTGPLYAAIGAANLRAWTDGSENVGHAGLSNLGVT